LKRTKCKDDKRKKKKKKEIEEKKKKETGRKPNNRERNCSDLMFKHVAKRVPTFLPICTPAPRQGKHFL
jgi:hypothetical protein